ncbi:MULTISPECIES: fluoride efflux transporter CrcB [unclassified Streptomyces]|uniref:fluoride efflux transporter CrcB n=1 Tax=unclassified Streptomyces TaxID=2593676 RepID=UPI0036FC0C65
MDARGQLPVALAVSAGGAIGAAARYGATLLWPVPAGGLPWTVLLVNASGCAVLGVVMVLLTEFRTAPHLLRPFLGPGICGGFTTFSTYAVDTQRLLSTGHAVRGLCYFGGTLLAALAAVWAASALTRSLVRGRAEGA